MLKLMSSSRFLNKEGLGNEVPFFICPFKVEETHEMYRAIGQLITQLGQQTITILEINLYRLTLELLAKRGLLEKIIESEATFPKETLFEHFESVLATEKYLIPAIAEKMLTGEFQIMFITGIGEVFPYIRSHNILNNLQKVAKDKPTVFFFPGEYNANNLSGSTLKLFSKLDDKYYRAFNIYHCQI